MGGSKDQLSKKMSAFKEDSSKYPSVLKRKKNNTNDNNVIGYNRIVNLKKTHFSRIGSKKQRQLNGDKRVIMFTNQELRDKLESNPHCYLTGDKINLLDSQSYSLDHIVPKSRGGDNSIENCGLTTKTANQMKSNMTVEEFLNECKKVLLNNGYKVEKI